MASIKSRVSAAVLSVLAISSCAFAADREASESNQRLVAGGESGPLCQPCEVDVLPAMAQVLITFGDRSENVTLTSDPLSQAVVSKKPEQDGVIPMEIVALSLTGNSSFGRVQIRAGRQFGLPASNGTSAAPLDPPYRAFFDVFFTLDLPDAGMSTRGFANSLSFIRYVDHLEAGFQMVAHPGRRCSTGPAGTGHCDIVDTTNCFEAFEDGINKGCCS